MPSVFYIASNAGKPGFLPTLCIRSMTFPKQSFWTEFAGIHTIKNIKTTIQLQCHEKIVSTSKSKSMLVIRQPYDVDCLKQDVFVKTKSQIEVIHDYMVKVTGWSTFTVIVRPLTAEICIQKLDQFIWLKFIDKCSFLDMHTMKQWAPNTWSFGTGMQTFQINCFSVGTSS